MQSWTAGASSHIASGERKTVRGSAGRLQQLSGRGSHGIRARGILRDIFGGETPIRQVVAGHLTGYFVDADSSLPAKEEVRTEQGTERVAAFHSGERLRRDRLVHEHQPAHGAQLCADIYGKLQGNSRKRR